MPSASLTWLLDVPLPELPDTPLTIPDRDNYTDDEVSTAVGKLVQGSIRRPYGILGERRTLDSFDDTMDAAAGVFILTPSSPFYVVLLGALRLKDAVNGVITDALDLLDAVTSTGRRVKPLTNITSLGNARSALLALENASAARDTAFNEIGEAPAFQRFDRHTDRFLDDAAGSIKVGENITQTPQAARKSLGTLVSTLTAAFQDVQRRAQLLSVGIENYNSLNLPALLAQGVISKTRSVLDDRISQLESLTPTQRLEFLRETALDVLAGKAVVKGFGSLAKSGEFVPIEGKGVLFSDATHPGNAAIVLSAKLDPYIIVPGADSLTFVVDSGPTMTIPIQQSFLAKLEGTGREPYAIVLNTNDKISVAITSSASVNATLTAGATQSAQQIVNNINAAITTQPVVAETFLAPEKFVGFVNATGAADPVVTFNAIGSSFTTLGVVIGDAVLVQTGFMAHVYFIISSVTSSTIVATRSGPGAAFNESSIKVSIGPQGRLVRFRIKDGQEVASLTISRSLKVSAALVHEAHTTLGLSPGMEVFSRRTRGDEVALSINSNASSSVAGVPRISAVSTFLGGSQVTGRTDPTNPTRVIASILRASADVTVPGGTATFAVSGAASAGVAVGAILTIRSAPTSSQVGLRGTVLIVTDSSVVATMNGAVLAATGLQVEFGVGVNAARDQIIRVLAPSPVAGDYRVLVDEANPTESTVDRPIPLFFGAGGQPLTFKMQVGSLRVDFQSTSKLVTSEISVSGTAASQFLTSVPTTAIGSSSFVLLDNDPKVLGAGDVLEVYSGQYNEPEIRASILGFELGQRLLEVDIDIPNGFLELDFSQSITTPFARIRKLQRNNYDAFSNQLSLWIALPLNQEKYFSDLSRFLNPLIVNENPTLAAVNTAKIHVQTLVQGLQQLQAVLASYQVDTVPQVDTLIDSFLSRGSDRAVDTLLEGRFTDFFGYNSEEVSYLGNALERLRDVSRLDLPVRRKQRKELVDQELTLSEHEDPDFEFDQSDTQDIDEPDIPGSFIEVPGSNF